MNLAASTSKGFNGTWLQQEQRFSWGADKDFLLTWAVPRRGKSNRLLALLRGSRVVANLNVTASQAARANGPLTLLYALSLCGEQGSLAAIMKRAQETKHVRLHVLGVNPWLEPAMQWKEFLVGPLSAESRRLVSVFKLPETPFKGVQVSMLFNGFDAKDGNTDRWAHLQRGPLYPDAGYSQKTVPGPYHSAVSEVPDLALAINPGFAHYPGTWWPTLKKLQLHKVPIIATGYSNSFFEGSSNVRVVYEHDRAVFPELKGDDLYLPPHSSVRVHNIREDSASWSNKPEGQCMKAISTTKSDTLCNDLDGNAFVTRSAGYGVRLLTRQPFSYCDSPESQQCQSSAVVSVFEPAEGDFGSDNVAPASLLRDGLLKMLYCNDAVHHHTVNCMKVTIKDQPDAHLREMLTNATAPSVLNAILKSCSDPY